MKRLKEVYPTTGVGKWCGLFGKSRQAFYEKQNAEEEYKYAEQIVVEMVLILRREMPRLGVRKLYFMLEGEIELHDIKMGRDKLCTLLQNNNLMLKPNRRYVNTTNSNHPYRYYPNLVEDFIPDAPEQLWVSDITYVRINVGFAYLSLITDAYSKRVVGYHLHPNLKTEGCIHALNMALKSLKKAPVTLIHHSDRGIQYCSQEYLDILRSNGIEISMSQKGNPYQNAMAERVNGILKHEFGLKGVFVSFKHALRYVYRGIAVYNKRRPHASCDYLTPDEAHKMEGELNKRWKPKTKEKTA